VTAENLPAFFPLFLHPIQKNLMAHFPGRLDPAPIFLHRYRDLAIMHIEAQLYCGRAFGA
jgi:hypothetical protein